jgi:alpha-beta hydrolase superfamily lysophospholipase
MLRRIRELWRRWYGAPDSKRSADAIQLEFVNPPPQTSDAVVFVHGLGGHFGRSWGQFPTLICSDTDLPKIDVLRWGYNATPGPGTAGVAPESKRLMSDLRENLQHAEHVFFVAHSLGGLTVLEGIRHELECGRARRIPARAVDHIVLYATPAMGVAAATLVKHIAKTLPGCEALCGAYIQELSSGAFVNSLIREILERVYRPKIEHGDENSKKQIPITACVATRDVWVERTSAEGIFSEPPPVYLDWGHVNVKLPVSSSDRRYVPVRNVLSAHFSKWFHELALRAGRNSRDGAQAATEFDFRCGHMVDAALENVPRDGPRPVGSKEKAELRSEFLRTIFEFGRLHPDVLLAQAIVMAARM